MGKPEIRESLQGIIKIPVITYKNDFLSISQILNVSSSCYNDKNHRIPFSFKNFSSAWSWGKNLFFVYVCSAIKSLS